MATEPDSTQQSSGNPRRLKLVMPHGPGSSETPLRTTASNGANDTRNTHEPSGSPERPSYSPVSPTSSHSGLPAHQSQQESEQRQIWLTEPDAPSVSLDDNSDAIAMRAAISILQMQRQQSLKDIKGLETLRKAAAQDPEAFVSDLNDGKLTPQPRTGIDVDEDDSDSETEQPPASDAARFDRFPAPQNVVRAPPVAWSKYHIVGEPLDRMHEVQRRYPGFKEEMLDAVQKPQPHSIASPYKAFADKLDDPSTREQR